MYALTFDQALTKAKAKPKTTPITGAHIDALKKTSRSAAKDLVTSLRGLSKQERTDVAEALIGAMMKHLKGFSQPGVSKGYPEFDPNQLRDHKGRFTNGTAVLAGMTWRGVIAPTLKLMQNALSTVTLVPSSKSTVMGALKDWWRRLMTDPNSAEHSGAVEEAAGRTMVTVILGAAALALAHAYIPAAVGIVAATVGMIARHLTAERGNASGNQGGRGLPSAPPGGP